MSVLGSVTSEIQSWAQVAVAVTIGVVAVVTYRRARNSVLQPLQTEVFKLQLEQARNVLEYLGGLSEYDLRRRIGLVDAVDLNARLLVLHDLNSLGIKVPDEAIREMRPRTAGTKRVVKSDEPPHIGMIAPGRTGHDEVSGLPLDKPVECVVLTPEVLESSKALFAMETNPFLPTSVTDALHHLSKAIDQAHWVIHEVSLAKHPDVIASNPQQFNLREFENAFSDEFHRRCPRLEPLAQAVIAAVRENFGLNKHFDFGKVGG